MGRFTSRPQGTPTHVRACIAAKQTVKLAFLTWTSSAFLFSGSRVAVATYSSVRLSRFKSHQARLTRGSPSCSRETCPHPTTSITSFTPWGHVALFAHYVGVSHSSAVLMMWCHSSRGAALTRLCDALKSLHFRHRRRHEERPDDPERSFGVFVPLAREMRVARLAARAEGDRRHAQGDRDVGVGRRARELGVLAEYPVRGDRRLHQRVGARRDTRRAVAQELDLDAEWRSGGGAAAVLVVRRARQRRAHRDVELRQRLRIFTAQVQIEPGLLRDR